MNILPVVFKQICQFSTLNFSNGHTFLEIVLPDLSPLWTPVLENMNLFSVQFRKGNNLSWGPCVLFVDRFGKFFPKSFRWKGVIFALKVWAIPTKNHKSKAPISFENHSPRWEASVNTTTPMVLW